MIKQPWRLKKVDLKDVWSKVAGDFTPGLSANRKKFNTVFRARVKQLDASMFDPQMADASGSFSENGAS